MVSFIKHETIFHYFPSIYSHSLIPFTPTQPLNVFYFHSVFVSFTPT